jgi:hypothetical protein
MPSGAYFIRSCPTCGRSLEVRVEYLGKMVSCQHCSAQFDTSDPPYFSDGASESSLNLLARAEELIESVKFGPSERSVCALD